MLTRLSMVIISQNIQISKHCYISETKRILYVNYISIKKNKLLLEKLYLLGSGPGLMKVSYCTKLHNGGQEPGSFLGSFRASVSPSKNRTETVI